MKTVKSKVGQVSHIDKKQVKTPISEEVMDRRTIVYKTCIDPTVIKLLIEKMKKELFTKSGFLKPKPEDIRNISMNKYYEPYIFMDGKYSVDFSRKHLFDLEVDISAEEIVILGHKFKPEPIGGEEGNPNAVIKLEGYEHYFYEDKATIILDRFGNEVPIEKVPFAPSEDNPKKILEEFGGKIGKLEINPDEDVNLLRSRIVKRPLGADQVEKEVFEVTDRAVIYVPIYEIIFMNMKTEEKKSLMIDGVTAKIIR